MDKTAHRSFPLVLKATNFTPNPRYSRLRCHNDLWAFRWCEGHNIPFFSGLFFFFSPATFKFPSPFLVPGPRAPFLDKEQDRFTIEPIVLTMPSESSPIPLTTFRAPAYIYGVFHNYYQLWHTLFDFIVPFAQFHRKRGFNDTRDQRHIFVKSDGVWMFHDMVTAISTNPVQILQNIQDNYLFENIVFGIDKPENKTVTDTASDMIDFKYNLNKTSGIGVRDDVLMELSIPNDFSGIEGKPFVVLIDRASNMRSLNNARDVEKYLKETCPHCLVKSVKLEHYLVREQIEITSRATVLIGVHGSGLANVMWMHPGDTHLIEILPYHYDCRDWYKVAAEVAQVNYNSVMNTRAPDSNISLELRACILGNIRCNAVQCHDYYRDATVTLELEALEKAWKPLVEVLKTQTYSKRKLSIEI